MKTQKNEEVRQEPLGFYILKVQFIGKGPPDKKAIDRMISIGDYKNCDLAGNYWDLLEEPVKGRLRFQSPSLASIRSLARYLEKIKNWKPAEEINEMKGRRKVATHLTFPIRVKKQAQAALDSVTIMEL